MYAQLRQRLTELQTEQTHAITRVTAMDHERSLLTEQILRRAGAIAELEALCQPPIVATKVEEDGRG